MFLNNFSIEDINLTNKTINLKFKQWMRNDYVDIIYQFEPIDENKSVEMYIDKYQLYNGQIKYSLELSDDIPIILLKE